MMGVCSGGWGLVYTNTVCFLGWVAPPTADLIMCIWPCAAPLGGSPAAWTYCHLKYLASSGAITPRGASDSVVLTPDNGNNNNNNNIPGQF